MRKSPSPTLKSEPFTPGRGGAYLERIPRAMTQTEGFTLVELLVALAIMAIMAGLSWQGIDVMLKSRELTQARVDEVASAQNAVRQWVADLDAIFPVNSNPSALTGVANSTTISGATAPLAQVSTNSLSSRSSTLQNQNLLMAIDWDGRVLRLVRRSSTPSLQGADAGLCVVGWTLRDNRWVRWQSPDITRTADLVRAWSEVGLWAQNPGTQSKQYETELFSSGGWQLYYFRQNAWSNPLSSAGTPASSTQTADTQPLNAQSNNTINLSNSVPDGIRLEIELPKNLGGKLIKDWVRPTFTLNRS